MSSMKKITLKSIDGEIFEIDEAVALKSQTIKLLIEVNCTDERIPIPNVTGNILAKVIEYCQKHVEANIDEDALKEWDSQFVKVDQGTLFDLIMAANYLAIESLVDLTCKTVGQMMRGKTPEKIRTIFKIENDYSPEEEEEVCRANQWAFE